MTISVVPLPHRFAGTSRSRHRARFILAPASAGSRSPTIPQSDRRVRQQRPICSHQRLSASQRSSESQPPPKPLPRQISIDRQALTAFPRVRSSEAFGRRPLIPGRPLAPGRHPKPFAKAAIRGAIPVPLDSDPKRPTPQISAPANQLIRLASGSGAKSLSSPQLSGSAAARS